MGGKPACKKVACMAPLMPSKKVANPFGKLLKWHSGSQASRHMIKPR
ncbi:hypothetical protein G2W53_005158 [Senna tora]|uniref:Uncharacterized protein n=1 Tax=Senna tora TaxID=362788 RepID=A0A834XCR2_9FABA|nr:hypothetical protein G2W53_005158 [Senna tora]